MAANRANTFGTFLQTMKVGKVATDQATAPEFDLETSAKQALQSLLSRSGVSNPKDLRDQLHLTPEQWQQVLDYLMEAGMVEQPQADQIVLTGYARDALGVFSIS